MTNKTNVKEYLFVVLQNTTICPCYKLVSCIHALLTLTTIGTISPVPRAIGGWFSALNTDRKLPEWAVMEMSRLSDVFVSVSMENMFNE